MIRPSDIKIGGRYKAYEWFNDSEIEVNSVGFDGNVTWRFSKGSQIYCRMPISDFIKIACGVVQESDREPEDGCGGEDA